MRRRSSDSAGRRGRRLLHILLLAALIAACTASDSSSSGGGGSSTAPAAPISNSPTVSPLPHIALPHPALYPPPHGPILFVSLTLRGHLMPLLRLAAALAARGNNGSGGVRVSFAAQEEAREMVAQHTPSSVKFVSLGRLPYAKAERREKLQQICREHSSFGSFHAALHDIYLPHAAPMYKQLHAHVSKERPALIVMDSACVAALDVAHHFQLPYVINHPTVPLRLEHEPHHLAASFHRHGPGHGMSLWERSVAYLSPRLLSVALSQPLAELNRLRWSHDLPLFHSAAHVLEPAIPTQLESPRGPATPLEEQRERERREHASLHPVPAVLQSGGAGHAVCRSAVQGPLLHLVNTALGLEPATPLPHSVLYTGPLLPLGLLNPGAAASSREDEEEDAVEHSAGGGAEGDSTNRTSTASLYNPPLPAALSSWLSSAPRSKPVVLLLFGSGTMSYLEGWQVKALGAGLADSKVLVLGALRKEAQRELVGIGASSNGGSGSGGSSSNGGLPKSFRIKSDLPQLAAISHRSVKLVLSPCGSATVHESLYFGKPLLCVPLLADQHALAARVVQAGAGLSLDKGTLDGGDVAKHLMQILRNATFRAQARRLGQVLRATGGSKLAADAIQRALHQHAFQILQQPEQLQCWHQVYQLDLMCFLFALFLLALLAVRAAFLCLVALVRWTRTKAAAGPSSATVGAHGAEQQPRKNALLRLVAWLKHRARGPASDSSTSDLAGASSQGRSAGSSGGPAVNTMGSSSGGSGRAAPSPIGSAGARVRSDSLDSTDSLDGGPAAGARASTFRGSESAAARHRGPASKKGPDAGGV